MELKLSVDVPAATNLEIVNCATGGLSTSV